MSDQDDGLMIAMFTLAKQIRADERERAAKIVEEWPVDTNYIVGKIRLSERRKAIAKAIREQK